MKSVFITSHETYKCVKYHTRGNSGKGFSQSLSHYGWQIPLECKVQALCHFYQSNPRWKWDVRFLSIEALELQERGINSVHHLPYRGEGMVVRIKYRERTHQPHGLTYDRFQPKMPTSLSFSGT